MESGIFGDDPIIVLGMHRSGTTIVARLLKEMGGHLGHDLSSMTCESHSFQRTNIDLLYNSNASWYNPTPFWDVLLSDERVEKSALQLQKRLGESSARPYWGKGQANSVNGDSTRFWGWKDPRNTLTLPAWRRVFPEAKIICVVRNGIDVAWSLIKRDQLAFRSRSLLRRTVISMLVRVIPQRWPEYKSRPITLEGAFELWAEYLKFADFNTGELPAEKVLRLRYEDLLQEPMRSLRRIADFVAATTTDRALTELDARLNTHRRYAFATNPDLREFYTNHCEHPQMVKHGYDRILDQGSA